MGKVKLLVIAVAASSAIYGCTTADLEFDQLDSHASVASLADDGYERTPEEALELASKFLSGKKSRGSSNSLRLELLNISSEMSSRSSESGSDPVAYVVNADNNEGFMLVSADKRMPAVLAFSETGTFTQTDDPEDVVNATFVNNLDKYKEYCIGNNCEGYHFPIDCGLFDVMINHCPEKEWHWVQYDSPYTDYVKVEHPNSPVGCVALATSIIATWCRDSVTIGDTKFDMNAIRDGMIHGQEGEPDPGIWFLSNAVTHPGEVHFGYTWKKTAMDRIAKLLYNVGEKVYTQYRDGESSSNAYHAYKFFINHGYTVATKTEAERYDVDSIISLIENDHLLFMRALNIEDGVKQTMGHAWVVDGCCYDTISSLHKVASAKINPPYPPRPEVKWYKTNVFLHCNWGEKNPDLVGYYHGDVFKYSYSFSFDTGDMTYFAVKKTREYFNDK